MPDIQMTDVELREDGEVLIVVQYRRRDKQLKLKLTPECSIPDLEMLRRCMDDLLVKTIVRQAGK